MADERHLGRPTKLHVETVRRLLEMYELGASQADACRYAGISPDTLQNWVKLGRGQLAYLETLGEGEHQLPDEAALVLLLDRAQGEFARAHLANIKTAARMDWRASTWLLERRFPEEWGKREKIEHTHKLDDEVERLIRERGLDEASAAKVRDFYHERAKRRAG